MRWPANICPIILLCVVQTLFCKAEVHMPLQERKETTNMRVAHSNSSVLSFSIVGRMIWGQCATHRKREENVEQR